MSRRPSRLVATFVLLVAMLLHGSVAALAQPAPVPPGQPARGPGGSDYRYPASIEVDRVDGPTGYYTFLPADAGGAPVDDAGLPVVLFLHGYSATDSAGYGAWIEHLVRRGAAVIYPVYQGEPTATERTDRFLPDAITGIRDAKSALDAEHPGAVDWERLALAGHSAGGWMAMQYAVRAGAEGLPVPTVLMPMMPGGCGGCGAVAQALGFSNDLSGELDPETLAIVLTAEDDPVVGTEPARRIAVTLGQLPADQWLDLTILGDDHGSPALVADHLTVMTNAAGQPDALDYYGPWRLLDALMSCRFEGEACDVATGGGAATTDMGEWSDGTPVTPLVVNGAARAG